MQPNQVLRFWGRPLQVTIDPLAGDPPGTPSPYTLWTYPHEEWVRFLYNDVQAIKSTRHPLHENGVPVPGVGTPLPQLLAFWRPSTEDAYGNGTNENCTVTNQHLTLSFVHDGATCNSLWIVNER